MDAMRGVACRVSRDEWDQMYSHLNGEDNNRGNARRKKGDLDGAIKDYAQAIRLKPDFVLAYYNRGVARSDKGDLDGAIKDYAEAIRLKPGFALAYYNSTLAMVLGSVPTASMQASAPRPLVKQQPYRIPRRRQNHGSS